MDKKSFSLYIVVSAVVLTGIMLIQLYGIRNAMRFQKEQFNGDVRIALNNVVNRLLEIQVDTNVRLMQSCSHAYEYERMDVLPLIALPVFDSIISKEFKIIRPDMLFDFGVYAHPDGKFFRISNLSRSGEILNSAHFVPISCLYQSEGYRLAVYIPDQRSLILRSVIWWAILLFFLILLLILSFYRIVRMFLNQKKLSDMKTDFVNNMTHEFKTPIASLSLAADMLLKPEISNQPCQVQRYAKIISEENNRLKNRVEQVLHITMVERGEFQMKMKPLDIHKILDEGMRPYRLLIRQQKGKLLKNYQAGNPMIMGDADHLENLVSNLVDNAIKYSIGMPEITIETGNSEAGVYFAIEDKGIGISSEHQQDIFRRFFRVSTGDIHDAKGFGLGLYYVKTVVQAHDGSITVKSQPGKGSRFEVFLPFAEDNRVQPA